MIAFAAWLGLLALPGCGETPRDVDDVPVSAPGWGSLRTTQGGMYEVSVRMIPEKPAVNDLFSLEATVRADGEPLETATVVLDARMPQHDHGMMTQPKLEPGDCVPDGPCTHVGGVYTAAGFKFHMGGAWTLSVDVNGPSGTDRATFIYAIQ
ncbi:MAG: FixH family protein [Myxococcota bacterium]